MKETFLLRFQDFNFRPTANCLSAGPGSGGRKRIEMLLRARGISAARWGHRSVAGVSVRNFVNQAVTAAGLVQPLEGCTVVALEQAVAAPFSTSRLADAGARVIKIERNDDKGDFARGYDKFAGGLSSYFIWLNRGKESVQLDLKSNSDLKLLDNMVSKADVFVQNFAPGATDRMGFGSKELRKKYPRLITVDISGYGDLDESNPLKNRKAYDMLVQAESGLSDISGIHGEATR